MLTHLLAGVLGVVAACLLPTLLRGAAYTCLLACVALAWLSRAVDDVLDLCCAAAARVAARGRR